MIDRWYVLKLKPGAARRAKARISPPVPEWRREESVAERSLRDLGVTAYLPRMKREIRHHRTKRRITRSFPLFSGYCFAVIPAHIEWRDVKEADGIAGAIGFGGDPLIMPEGDVERLQATEAAHLWDETREGRFARGEEFPDKRETARRLFRRGTAIVIEDGPFAGLRAAVERVETSGEVKALVSIFGRLTPVVLPIDVIQRVA